MNIFVCFPVEEKDRQRLREKFREIRRVPPLMPAPYTGSIQAACADCRMRVWVEPRQQKVVDAVQLCPWCMVKLLLGEPGPALLTHLVNMEKEGH